MDSNNVLVGHICINLQNILMFEIITCECEYDEELVSICYAVIK